MPLVIVAKARVLCGLRQCGVRRRWLDQRLREDETAETFYGNPAVVLLRAPFVERTIRERYGVVGGCYLLCGMCQFRAISQRN